MRDDDEGSGQDDRSDGAQAANDRASRSELFGEYSVISPGVHIVLDGRAVSCRAN
ncbi:MAG: hypothetical protein AAF666_05225 [Pseudomonadota bacterium]